MALIQSTSSIPQRARKRKPTTETAQTGGAAIPERPTPKAPRTARRKKTTSATTPVLPPTEASAPSADQQSDQQSDQQALLSHYASRVGYRPSRYQADLFAWVERGAGNAVVNAVAGGGKSTSAVSAAQLLPPRATGIFLAFNRHIVETLTAKLARTPMTARTIHSAGFGMLSAQLASGGRSMQQPDGRKYTRIARALTFTLRMTDDQRYEFQRALAALGSKIRVTLTDPRDRAALEDLCDQYGIVLSVEALRPTLYDLLPALLDEGERQAREDRVVDFDDMIWLPAQWKLLPPAQVDYLFVDELQDLSRAQLDTALRLLAPGGRFCGVGDEKQAIMGFSGAAVDSFHQAAERTQSIHLPLSICYRCPTSHLALAREIVPQIEARPGAPEGTIDEISRDKLGAMVRPGDMVICRLTAPLVEECIHLIEQGIPARVRGRDIGKQLCDIVRAVAHMPRFTWPEFLVWLGAFEESQLARLAQRDDNESAVESFQDRCAAIRACYQRTTAADPDTFCREMEALFDDGQPTVLLSTIHRAKGLEAPRVFILRPDKLPLTWAKQKSWQLQQEWHVKYVALTRATQALFWVY